MKNKLTYTGLLLGTLVGLVGCSTGATETQGDIEIVTSIVEPITIEFWHGMSGALGETMNELVETFNDTIGEEKGIEVEATYQGGYDDLKSKVMASIKAGNNPEIVQGTSNNIMEFIQSGYVQALDEYITHEEIGIHDYTDIYESYRLESSNYDDSGTIFSLPFSKSTDLLFYNKTFFVENGLELPRTWEEVVEVSKQIYELTGKPALSIDNTSNFLITYLFQAGAEYTNRQGEILFNNETSVEALTMLKENIDKGYWRLAGEDKYSSAPFLSQNVFMYLGSSAGEAYLANDVFEWDATTYPQINPEAPKYIQQGNNVAILNQNKTSEEVFAAYEFIKYLVSNEANLKWVTETGYLPIRESVVQSEAYQSLIESSNKTSKLASVESAKNGFVEALFMLGNTNSNIVRSELLTMIDEIVLTNADIQETLDFYQYKLK